MSIDDLQAQLRGALDQQFATLKQHYDQAVAEARRQGTADGERLAAARIEAARAEWQAGLEKTVAAARSEAEQQATERARTQLRALEQQLQQQLEQTVQHAVNSVKRTSELEIESARRRADDEVNTERQKGQAALEEERQRGQSAQTQTQQALDAANRALGEEQARAAAELDAVKQLLEAEIAAAQGQASAAQEEVASARSQIASAQGDAAAARKLAASAKDDVDTAKQQVAAAEQAMAAAKAQAAAAEGELTTAKAQAAAAEEELATAKTQASASHAELVSARDAVANLRAAAEVAAADAAAKATAAAAAVAKATAAAEAATAEAAAAKAALPPVSATPLAPAPPSASTPAGFDRLPSAVRSLDAAASLSQTLEALLQHAGAIAGRAALFLISGDRLKAWKSIAIPEIDVQAVESSLDGRDLLARAIQSGEATPASAALPAPPFARLTGDQAVAAPLMINGRAVAVLYADTGGSAGSAGWTDAVDLVARHASSMAALRAAMRTFDVLRGDATDGAAAGNGDESARRYARLLVSEIKLYNEAAVRAGRQQRDLRQRLRGEIDRALRQYEERVPPAVGARERYFQQELVQTLADGDPSLLGS